MPPPQPAQSSLQGPERLVTELFAYASGLQRAIDFIGGIRDDVAHRLHPCAFRSPTGRDMILFFNLSSHKKKAGKIHSPGRVTALHRARARARTTAPRSCPASRSLARIRTERCGSSGDRPRPSGQMEESCLEVAALATKIEKDCKTNARVQKPSAVSGRHVYHRPIAQEPSFAASSKAPSLPCYLSLLAIRAEERKGRGFVLSGGPAYHLFSFRQCHCAVFLPAGEVRRIRVWKENANGQCKVEF